MEALCKEGIIHGKLKKGLNFFIIDGVWLPINLKRILHLISQKYEFPYWQVKRVMQDFLRASMKYWGLEEEK